MQPDGVVEVGNIVIHLSACFLVVGIDRLADPLGFQTPEETLNRGVVPAVSAPTHALNDVMIIEELPECGAGVLTALIRVKQ